ncbi:energy-coupling factor transporter transmembrane protein EcfT [Elusimicrobium posterum]
MKEDRKVFLSPAFIVPVSVMALVFIFSAVFYIKINFFINRFFICLLPCGFLLFSFFMAWAAQRNKWFVLLNTVVLASILFSAFYIVVTKPKQNADSREIAQYLMEKEPVAEKRFYYASPLYPPLSEAPALGWYFKKFGDTAQFINIDSQEGSKALQEYPYVTHIWAPVCGMNGDFGGEEMEIKHFSCIYKVSKNKIQR